MVARWILGGFRRAAVRQQEGFLLESFLPESFLPESFLPESFLLESFLPESFLPESFLPELRASFQRASFPRTSVWEGIFPEGFLVSSKGLLQCNERATGGLPSRGL